jgi:glutaredoxin-like protein NrdH
VTVTVYTKPDCAQCDQTKKVLTKRGIAFDEVDVREPLPAESTRTVADWLKDEHNFISAPVVHVNYGDHGEWWSGFKIDKLLDVQRV